MGCSLNRHGTVFFKLLASCLEWNDVLGYYYYFTELVDYLAAFKVIRQVHRGRKDHHQAQCRDY